MSATPLDSLRKEVAAGQAVVVVGAGVSVAATGGAPTASWVGLLNDGVRFCEDLLGPSLPPGWAERRRGQVASGDLDELVGAAEDLTRRLGGPGGGEFGRWLASSIGQLEPASPSVLEALAGLGVPLATTNYDGLLESVTGRPPVTWRQSALFEQVLRGDRKAVLHLHGHWEDPESVVLGVRSYEAVVGNAHADAMRKALATTRSLVFVGCGAGLDDPNFGALRRWLAAVFASSPYRHYRLCLEQELAELWHEHGLDERIVPVAYGTRHEDLAPFLQRLVAQPTTPPSASQATPAIWNVSLPPNPYFIGREELLQQLRRDASTARSGAVYCQVITGLAGIGKTQLAVEYAYRHRGDYDLVWWIRAEDPITLIGDYAALAPAIGLAESAEQDAAVAGVRAWLEGKGRWLLIFDNTENPAGVAPLLPRSGNGHVLLTSRRDVGWERIAARVHLDVLQPGEAIEFLLNRTGQAEVSAQESDMAAAGRLADALGRLPLALEQAGGSIAEAGIFTLAQYLDLFQERSLELLERGQGPPGYEHTIGTTWTVAVGQLRQQAPAALDLLCLGAFLAPEELPSQLLTDHADVLPASLAASARDPLALVEVVRAARRYSLVRATGGSLTLHRLLQIVIRDGLNATDQGVWAGAAVRLLRAGFPDHGEDVDAWPSCRQLLPHALAAIEHAERLGVELEKVAWLLDRVARYATGRAQFSEARAYLERSLRLAESVLGSQGPEVAIIRSDLGVVLGQLADYAGAKVQLQQALPTIEAALGPSDPETAIRRVVLGGVLRELGDYVAAKAQFEQALAITEAAYGPNHPKVAIRRANLGGVLRDRGNLMAARAQYEKALNIARASLGENHPMVVSIRDGLHSVFPGSARPKRRKGSSKQRGRQKSLTHPYTLQKMASTLQERPPEPVLVVKHRLR